MTVPRRLAAFSLALAAAFGVGAAVGAVVGPIDVGAETGERHEQMTEPAVDRDGGHGDEADGGGHG